MFNDLQCNLNLIFLTFHTKFEMWCHRNTDLESSLNEMPLQLMDVEIVSSNPFQPLAISFL